MWGHMIVKHGLKLAAAYALAAIGFLKTRPPEKRACIFNYHRVSNLGCTDLSCDSWNVTPKRFTEHARWLAQEAECVPLDRLLQRVQSKSGEKPLVAVTFDDGFANFRHNVLPVLKQYGIPATLFVVTKYVGSREPYPFNQWGRRNWKRAPILSWRSITWQELKECLHSGLVSIGSHSHSHLAGVECSDAQFMEEAVTSRDLLRKHLGPEHASMYAYPFGLSRHGDVTPAYVRAVRIAGYQVAVTTDLGLVEPTADALALPRVEVTGHDLVSSLRAKATGRLGPVRILERLRQPRPGHGNVYG